MGLSQLFALLDMKENLVKHRLSLLLLVFACLLALAPGASAQTDCLNLAEADCAILQAAEANSENVKSAQISFAIDFSLGGLESFDPSAGGIEFHLSGQGPFTSTGVPDPTAMMSGDLASLLDTFNTQMDMNLSITMPDESFSTPFSFVITDGTLYFSDPESGEWVGMTGEALAAQFEQMQGMMGAMGGVDPSTMSDPTAMMGQLPPELITALSTIDFEGLAATPGFLNFQRLGDEQLMGQAMIPFQFTADFGTLFKSAEFQTAVNQLMQAAAQMDSGADSAEAAQMMMVVPLFLQNTTGTLNVTQWVGSTDQFIHKVAVDLQGAMDLSALAAAGGDASAASQMQPITIDFHFDVSFDQINGTFDIQAPEGARILTPEEMGLGS
jgi:hypothetical protein